MLSIRSVTVRVAGRILLDDASATIPPSHHVGLIGRNGTGKSTLLKVIGGELQPDLGSVELSGPFGRQNAIGWVRQEAPGGSETPIRSEEHTSELQSLMRISYAVFCLK